jgi:hypothetical protein
VLEGRGVYIERCCCLMYVSLVSYIGYERCGAVWVWLLEVPSVSNAKPEIFTCASRSYLCIR